MDRSAQIRRKYSMDLANYRIVDWLCCPLQDQHIFGPHGTCQAFNAASK
jgi:hypothetical protein